jgi:hypothetical protein
MAEPSTPPPSLTLPEGMTVAEAARILAVAAGSPPPTPSGRKRRRGLGDIGDDEDCDEEVTGFNHAHWKNLLSKSQLHWARWFSVSNEETVNNILAEAMGPEIMERDNQLAYNIAYGKVRQWSRQWQCETLKRFQSHVCPLVHRMLLIVIRH